MENPLTASTVFIALLGGILPAVFWLWFWLKEDRLHPEPRALIIFAFAAGMLATVAAYPIEKFIAEHINNGDMQLLFFWAIAEETLKYLAISIVALRSKYFDEPIDAVIYLVTIALGFAALENALFLINPLGDGDTLATILLGNFRFIGATLLHVVASGMIGIALAFTFYAQPIRRHLAGFAGLILAIMLHTVFNFSIIMSEGRYLYEIFIGLWIVILGILLICEKIKRIPPRSHVEHPHTGLVILPLSPSLNIK
jgi:RsiW-degrading membrane proteinase PrsW (M82 family)